jgi:hypothetical protein
VIRAVPTSRAALATLLVALALGAGAPRPALAFEHVRKGDAVGDDELPTLDGGRERLIGQARVNVLVFVRPGQKQSARTLSILAACERDLRNRSVRFAAIVSGSDSPRRVRDLVKKAGVRMPVLVDREDRLQARLGVYSHPLVAVADRKGRLGGWDYFTTVNHADAVRARILHALGDIDDAALQLALDPPASLDR